MIKIGFGKYIGLFMFISIFITCQNDPPQGNSSNVSKSIKRFSSMTKITADMLKEDIIKLPQPKTDGNMSLEKTLLLRRSVRRYRNEELTLEEISQLLWACQGVTKKSGFFQGRTAPSAGGFHPLEVFVFIPQGVLKYIPPQHSAEVVFRKDYRKKLQDASLGQQWISNAPAVFVIGGRFLKQAVAKYGAREERYIVLEAGCACENLLLQAVALELGGVPVGAFYDQQVKAIIDVDNSGVFPLFIIPVGKPLK